MKNSNTLGKSSFIKAMIIISTSMAFLYQLACFTGICGITELQSKIIFWALIVVLIPFGTYITYEKRRNLLSICVNIALPFEIYTAMATFRYISNTYVVVLAVALILSAIYFALIVFQKIKHKNHSKEIIYNRMRHAFLGTRTIIAILLLCVTIPVCAKTVFGHGLISSDVDTKVEEKENDMWSLSNNIEAVALLHEDNWETLNLEEKLDVLGVVKNIEMRYLGITHEVYLEAGDLEGTTLGIHNVHSHTIIIDIEHLNNSESKEVLGTLLHECKHVYDRACVELYNQVDEGYKKLHMFSNIAEFDKEFNNYVDGSEDMLEYYLQAVEISAREYSRVAVDEYFEYVDKYLNGEINLDSVG